MRRIRYSSPRDSTRIKIGTLLGFVFDAHRKTIPVSVTSVCVELDSENIARGDIRIVAYYNSST